MKPVQIVTASFLALVLLVVLVGGVWLYSNQIVGKAIERGGTYALGVDTEVGFVRLRLLLGDFAINWLRVDNPPGFDEPSFLTLRRGYVDVEMDTLRRPVVTIPLFTLEGIELALERSREQNALVRRYETGR